MTTTTEPSAYTVGATKGYETYLDTDSDAGKGVGGIAFRTREEAQAVLDAEDGFLPRAWIGHTFTSSGTSLVGP